jgi:hypothetical protein
MSTPIWLLDVDGVINAFDETRPVLGDWDDWKTFTARGFPIRYSPAMVSRILALHQAGTVEVRWLTTWGQMANTALTEFGLPQFAVAAEQPIREVEGWWKYPTARDLFEQGHAIIWTDDDIPYCTDAVTWLRDVKASDRGNDMRAYAPQGAISQHDMEDIETWLADRAEAAA